MPPGSRPQFADQDGAHALGDDRSAVHINVDVQAAGVPLAHARDEVGTPAESCFEARVRAGHQCRVEAQAGHDQEGVVSRLHVMLDPQPPDVDRPFPSSQRESQGMVRIGKRQAEVSGQQVSGAERDQPHRYGGAGQCPGDGTCCAVAADRDHDRRTQFDCPTGLPHARVLGGRLEPERLRKVSAPKCRGVGRTHKSVGRQFKSEAAVPEVQQQSTAAGPLFGDTQGRSMLLSRAQRPLATTLPVVRDEEAAGSNPVTPTSATGR
jgi:hypothetical protein